MKIPCLNVSLHSEPIAASGFPQILLSHFLSILLWHSRHDLDDTEVTSNYTNLMQPVLCKHLHEKGI